jgi:hypothetical protein
MIVVVWSCMVVENEFFRQNYNWVAIESQWIAPYIWWVITFVTHATCLIALTMYEYGELQVVIATQNLNCSKLQTTISFIMFRLCYKLGADENILDNYCNYDC